MTDKQIIIDGGVCLNCGAKTKKHILMCDKCTEEMGTVIAHKFTIDKQTKEIKQLNKQLKRKKQECEELKAKCSQLKQTLTEIKEIAQYDVYTSSTDLCLKLNWIKKKISECEGNNG